MIALTFRDFYNEKFERKPYSLYLVRDGDVVLYIGISSDYLWNRWFGGGFSHMRLVPTGKGKSVPMSNGSTIANKIEVNYPESAYWTIELWINDDCIEHLSKFEDVSFLIACKPRKTEEIEASMIHHFKPLYNGTHNRGGSDLTPTKKERAQKEEDRKAYGKIFG